MGRIINYFDKYKSWNAGTNKKDWMGKKATMWVIGILLVYGTIYLLLSIGLMYGLQRILLFFDLIVISFQNENYTWLIYGILFAMASSFFVQGIPRKGEFETPKKICLNFQHYFSYFFAFIVIIEFWMLIILIIINTYI